MTDYPADWPHIARAVKEAASWRCVRCGHPHESPAERVACDAGCDATRHPGGLDDGRLLGWDVEAIKAGVND